MRRLLVLASALLLLSPLAQAGDHAVADPSTIPHISSQPAVAYFEAPPASSELVWPSGGVAYDNTYDFTLTALDPPPAPAAGGYFLLSDGAFASATGPQLAALAQASSVEPTNDCEHGVGGDGCASPTLRNVTFPGQRFDAAGAWDVLDERAVSDPMTPDDFSVVATFSVNATDELGLSASASTWTYSPSASFGYTLTLVNASGGPVPGATLTASPAATGLPNGALTNANGQISVLVSGTPGAGVYGITGAKDVTGDGAPDVQGETNLTILAAPLALAANATAARVGSQERVAFTPILPDANASFAFTGQALASGAQINVSVAAPDGGVLFANVTRGASADAVGVSDAAGASLGIDFSTGQVLFTPGPQGYEAGAYAFSVSINVVGAAATAPEYAGALAITPQGGADVTLSLTDGHGNALTSIPVLPTSGGALQAQTVHLVITGSTPQEHPTCESGGPAACRADPPMSPTDFVMSDVGLGGALLTGEGYNDLAYSNATGDVTIRDLVPTGAGDVTFSVTWKGETTSLSVPTTRGAAIAASPGAIPVSTEQNVTVSVHDAFGDAAPTATITGIFEDGTAVGSGNLPVNPFPLTGNGTADNGQGGAYRLDLKAATRESLVLQATIQPPGGEASYALVRLPVTALHDLQVGLSDDQTSAGLPTSVSINATLAGLGVSPATAQVYFLTPAEKADLLATGALPTASGQGVRFFGSGLAPFASSSAEALNLTAALGADAYAVYVEDAAGANRQHDDLDDMPTFTAHPYLASWNPTTIPARDAGPGGVAVNLTITDWLGDPLPDGSAIRYSVGSTGSLVDDGALNVTGLAGGFRSFALSGGDAGAVAIEAQPPGSGAIFAGAEGSLAIADARTLGTEPAVSIASPIAGETVSGAVHVQGSADAPNGQGLVVEVRIDGGAWQGALGNGTWGFSWDTAPLANGAHLVEARARTPTLTSAIAGVQVRVQNEHAPVVSIRSPASLAEVSGILAVTGDATDADGDAISVEVRVDAGPWEPASGAATWSRDVDTGALPDGLHDIEARASDGTLESALADVQVDVRNALPQVAIGSPAQGATVSGQVLVAGSASVDGGAIDRVQARLDGGAWQDAQGTSSWLFPWDASQAADGGHLVEARAWQGQRVSAIAGVSVRVANPPSVAILAPAPEAGVGAILEVRGAASGGADLAVEVRVDQGPWEPASGASDWSRDVDTRALADGLHDVQARASAEGVLSAVADVQVQVHNDAAPALAIDGPAAGDVVGGDVQVHGRAFSPQHAIASVQWAFDGAPLRTAFGTINWSFAFDARPLGQTGNATLLVVATDDAGVATGALLPLSIDNRPDPAVAPADLSIERAPLRTDFGSAPNDVNEQRVVHVVVRNRGAAASLPGSLNLTAQTRDPLGRATTRAVGAADVPAIAPGGWTEVALVWDTTGTLGDVTLTARLMVSGPERDAGNDAASLQTYVGVGGLGFGLQAGALG